jgi:transcriptional regulator GlxA family with amidase domain
VNCAASVRGSFDTLIVPGGDRSTVGSPPEATLQLVARLVKRARRIASVCTGALLLARTGLLDGRRATTHWNYATELQALRPQCRVDCDRIFIRDGNVWTSAGATAGIDLALAFVEEDLGLEISRVVARALVVDQRRQGGQTQYSALLKLEPRSGRIRRVLGFARQNLHEDLSVPRLADVAGLSPRQFSRAFVAETGSSPAKAVERLRAEAARPLVEDGAMPLDAIARSVGFSDPERMRQAFIRSFGKPPQSVRRAGRAHRAA